MKRAAFPLAILAALVVGFAGSQLVSTAQAQTARTATCTIFGKLDGQPGVEKWLTEQATAGKTEFITVSGLLCAM